MPARYTDAEVEAADSEALPGPKWLRKILAEEMERRYGRDDEDAARIRSGQHAMTTGIVALAAMQRAIKEAPLRRRK